MAHLRLVLEYAKAQHGLVARFQYRDIGIRKDSLLYVLRNPAFERVARGVYRVVSSPSGWHQQAMGAILTCGENAVLSNVSALINFGLLPQDFSVYLSKNFSDRNDPLRFDVSSRRDIRYCKDINFHRLTSFDKITPRKINGIPTMDVNRAIAESAQAIGHSSFSKVVYLAISRRLTSPTKLYETLCSVKTARGRIKQKPLEVVEQYLGRSTRHKMESVLENRFFDVLKECCGDEIIPQYKVRSKGRTFRLDFAIVSRKIAIEVDGFAYHGSISELAHDHERQNALVLLGWRVIRINAKMTNEHVRELLAHTLAGV